MGEAADAGPPIETTCRVHPHSATAVRLREPHGHGPPGIVARNLAAELPAYPGPIQHP